MTAMSSKRTSISVREPIHNEINHNALAGFGLILGIVLLALGIKFDSAYLALPGFLAFAPSFLFLNTMFWAHVMEKRGE